MAQASTPTTAAVNWAQSNAASLELEFERLRLLFERKLLWLKQCRQAMGDSFGTDATPGRLAMAQRGEDEFQFYIESAACRAIECDIASVREEMQERRATFGLSSLDLLSALFRLSDFERDLLLLCLAAEDDPSFAPLCGYVSDDAHMRYPTFDLALGLFCTSPEQRTGARAALTTSSALRRFHMFVTGDAPHGAPRTLRPIALDERIADYLHGFNRLDEAVAQMVRPVLPIPLAGRGQEIVDRLLRWVESGAAQESWPVIHLTGPSGAGKLAVAHAFCARAGLQLYTLDAAKLPLPDSPNSQTLHALVQRETLLTQMATYLDLSEVNTADRSATAIVRDWVERAAGVLIAGSQDRWTFRRSLMHLSVQRPDAAEQRQLWTQSLKSSARALNGHLDSIVHQFDFGPETIAQAAEAAHVLAKQRAAAAISAGDLWNACRDQIGWKIQAMAQRLEPVYTWDDIVLPDDVLRQLREIADQVAARAQVYEAWDFGAKLPRGRGISVLFSGPSGTGKTMSAEVLANQLSLDLHRIDLAGVVSKYIGETEKNLRSVFDAAEQTGAILFFDEADALFGKRTEVKDSHDRYANIETNYLLQRMEDYRGLGILCTNRRSALDRAFLRRLRFLVDFPAPDAAHRKRIWEKVFPKPAPVNELDTDALSRLEVTGGNIRNIALNAAFLAAGEGSPIDMAHVLHAARREYSKIDKLLTEAEFGRHYRTVAT
jgi:ATP-dependent 26S proteasome regulatory subunit